MNKSLVFKGFSQPVFSDKILTISDCDWNIRMWNIGSRELACFGKIVIECVALVIFCAKAKMKLILKVSTPAKIEIKW